MWFCTMWEEEQGQEQEQEEDLILGKAAEAPLYTKAGMVVVK